MVLGGNCLGALDSHASTGVVPERLEAELLLEHLGINSERMAVLIAVVREQLGVDLDFLADPVEDLSLVLNGHHVLLI